MVKFVTTSGLARFYTKISSLFALKKHNHEIDNINNLQTTLSKKIDLNISDVDPAKSCMWFNTHGTGGNTDILNLMASLILDSTYPVGSIYMSVNNSNPDTLLGGTWEKIQDRFLLASGTTYSAGSIGGEAEVTLTVNEIPNHNHGAGRLTGNLSGSAYSMMATQYNDGNSKTESTGGSKPHNNMPPYLTVNMWKRIA